MRCGALSHPVASASGQLGQEFVQNRDQTPERSFLPSLTGAGPDRIVENVEIIYPQLPTVCALPAPFPHIRKFLSWEGWDGFFPGVFLSFNYKCVCLYILHRIILGTFVFYDTQMVYSVGCSTT